MDTVHVVYKDRTEDMRIETGTILSTILQSHSSFDLPCGGKGRCQRCRVRIEGAISAPTALEQDCFHPDELRQGWRLACMTQVTGDIMVYPCEAIFDRIQADGQMPKFDIDPLYQVYGVAVDIGTTTVCMRLYGQDGLLGSLSRKNPQTAFGGDVISRIEHALAGQGADLSASICLCLQSMMEALTESACVEPSAIDALVFTGNTTMLYLLTQQHPEPLSHAPFIADRLFGEWIEPSLLFPNLTLGHKARCYLPRCLSAFVGADITTAVLASGLCQKQETSILIDIGTNGEIALWHEGKLIVCSTAAGPAFEGAGLSCGVYGVRGAVDHVWLQDGQVRSSTIESEAPVGICGSGVVDALAVMLDSGVMDETGALEEGNYYVAEGVFISAKDVRQIQLAKSAIRAGMETLLHVSGLRWEQIDTLLIAGGFGSYLNLKSAATIGLIPQQMVDCSRVLGNAALTGASMLLLRKDYVNESQDLAIQAHTIALDANPYFMDQYVTHMLFE